MSQVCLVDSREFYNLIVPCEFLLLDLRNKKKFENNHVGFAEHVEENFCNIYNDADIQNHILIYKDENTDKIFYNKVLNYFKDEKISQLSNSFDEFSSQYPFLCTKNGLYDSKMIYPAHIIDNIFLSSYYVTQQREVLISQNIKYILNVSNDCKNYFQNDKALSINYHQCKISDSNDNNPSIYFNECHQFFDQSKDGNILVHCYQGISRSSTMIISVLIQS
eukprot:gene4327-7683_t